MILDVDLGNTRLKWRVLSSPVVSGICEYENLHAWVLPLSVSAKGRVKRVRVSAVVGAALRQEFVSWSQRVLNLQPEFAVVVELCAQVRCVYQPLNSLGVDRWLAMLAAWRLENGGGSVRQVSRACVVVDCGTAITVDVLTATGLHQGGYILPGFNLMAESLGVATANARLAAVSVGVGLGSNTSECIAHGGVAAVVALIEGVYSSVSQSVGEKPAMMLTGGAVDVLLPFLQDLEHVTAVDTLVLDGLTLALP